MSRSLDSGAGEAQPEAGLYCMDPQGQVKTMLTGLYLGNGLAWSRDGRTFYYIDTMLHNVQVFDFDPDTRSLSNGREAFAIPAELGLPDGMTIDCEGKLWVAMFGGGAVLRFDPETGAVLDRVELPCPNVTCACFGGPEMEDLFITTGRPGDGSGSVSPGRQCLPGQGRRQRRAHLSVPGVSCRPEQRLACLRGPRA